MAHSSPVTTHNTLGICFSPDGQLLAAGSVRASHSTSTRQWTPVINFYSVSHNSSNFGLRILICLGKSLVFRDLGSSPKFEMEDDKKMTCIAFAEDADPDSYFFGASCSNKLYTWLTPRNKEALHGPNTLTYSMDFGHEFLTCCDITKSPALALCSGNSGIYMCHLNGNHKEKLLEAKSTCCR